MARNWQDLTWKLGMMISLFTGGVFTYFGNSALAQITPDRTLGTEGSVVTPLSPNVDRIDGGAIRGSNLFHSFEDFNVNEGRGAYFANPSGIENILSRVTGGNASKIFGTLGVLGNANLYLLNPNGIIFGPNARLDIRGSFVGSTADSIVFGDRTLFRATDTQTKPLLTVAVPVGLQYGTQQAGAISNTGNLAVGQGQKLALVGGTVTSSGQLTASGGTVQVLGDRVGLLDNARIDVSGETGGGTVLIGGDFQGKGEVPNAARTFVGPGVTINADALTSGDGGRVIVWADEATGFYGNISARGGRNSGSGGFVEVSGKQNLIFDGKVDLSAPNGNLGTLLLDPENIRITNNPNPEEANTVSIADLQTQANVVLEATNDITVDNGLSLNFDPTGGLIKFTADADKNGFGSFLMDTGQTIKTDGRAIEISGASLWLGNIDTSSNSSRGGDVTLEANNGGITTGFIKTAPTNLNSDGSNKAADVADVSITSNGSISIIRGTPARDGIEQNDSIFAGLITIDSLGELSVSGFLNARTNNSARLGDIRIGERKVPSSVTLAGISTRNGTGNGGNISITTTGLLHATGAIGRNSGVPIQPPYPIDSFSIGSEAIGNGNGGTINISADGGITTAGIVSNSRGVGNGGNITLNSSKNGAINIPAGTVDSSSQNGNGGIIKFDVAGNITTGNILSYSGSNGQGGDIALTTNNGSISTSNLNSSAFSNTRSGGKITLEAAGSITTDLIDTVGVTNLLSGGGLNGADVSIRSLNGPINISLAYQQLGEWQKADENITKSLNILNSISGNSKDKLKLLASALEVQGKQQLAVGKPEESLKTWQQAASHFKEIGDRNGVIRTQIHQSLALQELGRYREAYKTLALLIDDFPQQPSLQGTAYRVLGNVIREVGLVDEEEEREKILSLLLKKTQIKQLKTILKLQLRQFKKLNYIQISKLFLERSLEIFQKLCPEESSSLQCSQDIAETYFSLGNTQRNAYYRAKDAQERVISIENNIEQQREFVKAALEFYDKAENKAIMPITKVQLKLNKLDLLINWKKRQDKIKTEIRDEKNNEELLNQYVIDFSKISLLKNEINTLNDNRATVYTAVKLGVTVPKRENCTLRLKVLSSKHYKHSSFEITA